jgi:hypothetical protein
VPQLRNDEPELIVELAGVELLGSAAEAIDGPDAQAAPPPGANAPCNSAIFLGTRSRWSYGNKP